MGVFGASTSPPKEMLWGRRRRYGTFGAFHANRRGAKSVTALERHNHGDRSNRDEPVELAKLVAGIVPGLVRQPSAAGRGEAGHCSMAAIPTIEEEDARRPNRERENLVGERTRIVNRIKATLARFGIRSFKFTLRHADERLNDLRTAEAGVITGEYARGIAPRHCATARRWGPNQGN